MSFRFWRCGAGVVLRAVALLGSTFAVAPTTTAHAQTIVVAGPQRATRAELAARVADLEQQIAKGSARGDALKKMRQEVDAIRNRLVTGDFRVGDRFVLTVRQDSVRSDTVAVRDSLKVSLLNLPDVSLVGVLRAELDERMNAHLSTYLRNVEARTNVLTRISILGAVARPGYYYAAPDRPMTDVVMLAGGPAPNADLAQLEVRRGATKLLRSKDSRRVLKEGRTLEQLDVQSGDDVRIPERRRINWQLVIQLFFILSSLLFAFVNFLRWYYDRQ